MQFPINVSPAAKYLLDSCTLHLQLHLLLLLLPVLHVVCVCQRLCVACEEYNKLIIDARSLHWGAP